MSDEVNAWGVTPKAQEWNGRWCSACRHTWDITDPDTEPCDCANAEVFRRIARTKGEDKLLRNINAALCLPSAKGTYMFALALQTCVAEGNLSEDSIAAILAAFAEEVLNQ